MTIDNEVERDKNSRRCVRGLSKREQEVMNLFGGGLSEKAVAKSLGISEHTVHTHIKNIHQTLDVHNRIEALNTMRDCGCGHK